MNLDARLIQQSFALVDGQAQEVTGHFYALLFLENPALRDMFPPMMDGHRDRLFAALAQAVREADRPQELVEHLRLLGRDHRRFGVRPEHYELLTRCLLAAMKRFAGPAWTPRMDAAWLAAFEFAVRTMIGAAQEAAKSTPAFWTGRVVAHRRVGASLALVTLETDHPYPFRPGQAATIETLRWPRVWRPYSIANAPRPDGRLIFHVRAVDGGWVSSALVNHTRVGDTMRLGAAVGAMVCDPVSYRDIVLAGGGTGIAPILAMAEDLTRWNTKRRVTVYYGVRKADELYALEMLEALRSNAPWLTIVPCVSHDPGFPGEHGLLPDVLARHGTQRFDWAEHDVYVSGPAMMVRATLARLACLNVPEERILFDACDGADRTGEIRSCRTQRRTTNQGSLLQGTAAQGSTLQSTAAQGSTLQSTADQGSTAQSAAARSLGPGPKIRKVPSSAQAPVLPALPILPDGEPPPQPQPLPQRQPNPQRAAQNRRQASKSSSTCAEVGSDWQVSTKPPLFSSGSRA
ncbi:hypothetical protein KGA66_12540 [Actinocrinis puniceicyclus]|uniref:nitric oxide dioxygenase n=1 Tax=Actinocrinis puniceicyclus TaxID=977794 RepID=A0A8J8BC86_9ACTN|nr:globin domain-containing protein [Actinocrinis puniceicyclus]MBS2963878.1 hypothetical protein [Actinocrinis puniceicyclus]